MPSQSGGRNFFFRAFRTGWKSLTWRFVLFIATLCLLTSLFIFVMGSWGLFCLLTIIRGPLVGFSFPGPLQNALQTNLQWHGTDLAVFTGILKVEGSFLSTSFELLEEIESLLGTSNSQLFLLQTTLASLAFAIGSLILIHSISKILAESTARKAGSLFFLKLKLSPGLALKHSENLQEQLGHITRGGYALLCLNQPTGFIFVFSALMTLVYYPGEILLFAGLLGLEATLYSFLLRFFWQSTIRNSLAMKMAANQLQGGAPAASFSDPNWIWNSEVKNYLKTFTSSGPYSTTGFIFLMGLLLAWLLTAFFFTSNSSNSFFVFQDFFFFTFLIALLAVSAWAWVNSLKHIENGIIAANVLLHFDEAKRPEIGQGESTSVPTTYKQIQLDHFSLQHSDGKPLIEQTNLIFQQNQFNAISGLPKDTSSFFSLALAGKFPFMGELRIDNVNLRRISNSNLTALIGLIPQDGGVLPGSIIENLNGGYFDSVTSKVLTTTRKLRLHKVISLLPNGYSTKINQNSLSPLNAFLLGLGRAILQEKKILIMEPPMAQLSPSEEKLLLQSLKQVKNNRTVLVFTNAPFLLKEADRIVVFQYGNLEKDCPPEGLFQSMKVDQPLGSTIGF